MTVANPYVDLIRNDQTQDLRQSLLTAVDKNPDQEAGLQGLARQYGLPVDAVREDVDSVQRRAKLDAVDYPGLLRYRPVTADLLAEPQRAAIAHDDIDNLSTLESLLNSFKRGIPALQSLPAVLQVFNQAAGLDQLDAVDKAVANGESLPAGELGVLAESYAGLQTPAERQRFRAFYAPHLADSLSASAERLADLQSRRQAIPLPAVADALLQAPDWPTAWETATREPLKLLAALGPESLLQSGPGLLAAVPAGIAAGPVGAAAVLGSHSALVDYAAELVGNLQSAGVDVSDPAAIRQAMQDPVSRAKFSLQAAQHATVVGGLDALAGGLAGKNLLPKGLVGWLSARPWSEELANLAVQITVQAGLGAAGEAGGELAAGKAMQPGEVLAEAFAGLFAAPGEVLSASAKRLSDYRQHARQAVQWAALLGQIDSVAAASRVLKRDPQAMHDFVAAALAGSQRGELRIDAKDLLASGTTEQLTKLLPEVVKQLPAALALGREVRVPVSAYVSKLAATDLAPVLAGQWRVGATPFSRDAALLYQQQRDAAEQAEIERLSSGDSEPQATAPELATVKAAVMRQLEQVSPFSAAENALYAELHAHFYATQAQRFGVTPEELFAFMGANLESAELDGQASGPLDQDFRPGADVRGVFNPHTRSISLFPQADLSTFLHESGHLFLEIQFDLTTRLLRFAGRRELSPAQQALIADSNMLLAWFGLQSLQEWRQLSFEQMRVFHEQFATGFEKYLYQGVAPGLGLARIFATFRQWLMAVYAHFKGHWPGAALPDDVRGVFDRMLATDAAIRQMGEGKSGLPCADELAEAQRQYREVDERYFAEDGNPKAGALLTPNGEPSKLTKYQWIMVRTDNFKRYYGDWEREGYRLGDLGENGGKIPGTADAGRTVASGRNVSEFRPGGMEQEVGGSTNSGGFSSGANGSAAITGDGEPVIFYHGTSDDIKDGFNLDHPQRKDQGWLGVGVYAIDHPLGAKVYADIKAGRKLAGQNIMPLFVAVKNPYIASFADRNRLKTESKDNIKRFTQYLIAQGFDGVILKHDNGVFEIVAFDSAQVKSAIANQGTFSPAYNHLFYQDGVVGSK
jgi:hypothetical protein